MYTYSNSIFPPNSHENWKNSQNKIAGAHLHVPMTMSSKFDENLTDSIGGVADKRFIYHVYS